MLPEYCFPVSENACENGRCVRRRNSMASVTLKNVKKIYPFNGDDAKKKKKKKGEETTEKKVNLQITDKGVVAVQEFSLDIKDKEFIVLVGPSGCGKSTTLRMIAGLEEISEGELYIGDRLVNDVAPKDRDIAMVFQNYALYPHMTVYENMAFALKLRHAPKDEIDKKVKEAAEILDITQYLDRKPKALSGGQRQRVAIGRAIVRNPAVFLMDELPVVLHQDALPLRGIVRLYLVVAAAEFTPGTLQVIQPPDFRRAGRDPNHTGLEFRAQPGKDVVVNILVLFANQRHRADLADKVKLVVHHRCFFPPPKVLGYFRCFSTLSPST